SQRGTGDRDRGKPGRRGGRRQQQPRSVSSLFDSRQQGQNRRHGGDIGLGSEFPGRDPYRLGSGYGARFAPVIFAGPPAAADCVPTAACGRDPDDKIGGDKGLKRPIYLLLTVAMILWIQMAVDYFVGSSG